MEVTGSLATASECAIDGKHPDMVTGCALEAGITSLQRFLGIFLPLPEAEKGDQVREILTVD